MDPQYGLETNIGTPLFMAPELLIKQPYTEKVDIWAIGIIAFFLLTGDSPIAATNEAAYKKILRSRGIDFNAPKLQNLSEQAINFLKCCLEQNVAKRHSAK